MIYVGMRLREHVVFVEVDKTECISVTVTGLNEDIAAAAEWRDR